MDGLVETFEHEGKTIKIYYDDSREDPREWSNLGKMLLGNDRQSPDEGTFLRSLISDRAVEHIDTICEVMEALTGDYDYDDYLKLLRREAQKTTLILPLAESYRGVRLGSFGCAFGFIYVPYTDIRKEYNVKHMTKRARRLAQKCLEQEIETYNQYCEGDVYGYVIDEDGDSCWGFYGLDYCRQEAISAATTLQLEHAA